MKTRSTILVIAFALVSAHFSTVNAQCSVTITGKKILGSPLIAKTGDCHVEVLSWQLNGETIFTEYQTQFKRKGVVAAGGNDYGAASNQLAAPGDVHVDADGNIYVLDAYNNRVQKWAPGAAAGVTVAGGHGLGSAANQFFLPQGFFVEHDGTVYVADLFNNRVQKWIPGAITGVTVAGGNGYGSAANQLSSPKDVYVDATGNIFVTDGDNNRVQKWAQGAVSGVTVAGGNGYGSAANQLRNPFSLFVDEAGNVYISDRSNNRIQKWAPGSTSGMTVAAGMNGNGQDSTQLNDPRGLYVDSFGRIYVADYFNNRIQKWVPGMEYGITVAGRQDVGETPGKLYNPSGVYMSAEGDLYVADEGNNRVQKYSAFNYIKNKFTPATPGKYRVIATCSNGLTDTSAEVEIGADKVISTFSQSNVNAEKIINKDLSVYPNPASSYTILKFSTGRQEQVTIQLTDISGKVVLRKNVASVNGENMVRVDVSKIANGNYIISITDSEKKVQSTKLYKL